MQITTLASGSSGNCTLIRSGNTNILIDAGISMKRIRLGLNRLGLEPRDISAVFVTHEHSDHVGGLKTMTKQFSLPVLAPRTVANHLRWSIPGMDEVITVLDPGRSFELEDLMISPFSTPHGTSQSVGYRVDGDVSFGFCTDLGHVTDEVAAALEGVRAAVLEANHDVDMLRAGSYPLYLKRRILSDHGHLSNGACGELAVHLVRQGLETLVLGHISEENNTHGKAKRTVGARLETDCREHAVLLHTAPKTELLTVSVGRNVPCSA